MGVGGWVELTWFLKNLPRRLVQKVLEVQFQKTYKIFRKKKKKKKKFFSKIQPLQIASLAKNIPSTNSPG